MVPLVFTGLPISSLGHSFKKRYKSGSGGAAKRIRLAETGAALFERDGLQRQSIFAGAAQRVSEP